MRIIVVTSYYLPSVIYGGPVQAIHALNKTLFQLDHQVSTYTTNANGIDSLNVPVRQSVLVDEIPVTYYPRWWFGRQKYPFTLFFSQEMARSLGQLRSGDFDLMLIHASWGEPGRLAAKAAKRTNTPYIYYTHGAFRPVGLKIKSWKKRVYYHLIEKTILQNANGIVVNNKLEKDTLQNMGIQSPIKNIPWGINQPNDTFDVKVLNNLPPNIQSHPYILFIGRLNPIKGLDLLIDSFSINAAPFPEWRLILAGPDENGYKRSLENMVREHRLGNKVYFPGLVEDENKEALLSNADLCVLTSYSESFGISALEAMAHGKPIVITSSVGLSEYGVNTAGRVVPPDRQALAGALGEMMGDEHLRRVCGANAWRLAQTKFTWQAVARQSLEFFEEVIKP